MFIHVQNTVGGRNPAPPWIIETLKEMACLPPYQLVQDFPTIHSISSQASEWWHWGRPVAASAAGSEDPQNIPSHHGCFNTRIEFWMILREPMSTPMNFRTPPFGSLGMKPFYPIFRIRRF